jgi:uncharacterized protein YkwD
MSRRGFGLIAAVGLAGALAALSARADVIFQPGGGKIVGEIVAEKPDYVEIKTRAGGILRVPRDEIDKIERGPVPVPPAPPSPPPASPEGPRPPGPGVTPPPLSPGGGPKKKEGAEPARPVSTPAPPIGVSPLRPGGGRTGGASLPSGETFGVDETLLQKPRERAVQAWFERHGGKLKEQLPGLVKERRKAALAFINDPQKYPDANHGAAAQPEVDALVDAVRRAWQDPFAEALTVSAELQRLLEELEEVADSDAVRAKVNKALAPAFAPPEARDAEALAWNAKGPHTVDPEERACVEATNRYRMMMGLKALRMDERLLRAARKHSKSMVELGFFDHTSPVKGMETPEKRVAAEGANYSAENIAFGSASGEGAFDQWYNSSGHHRNIVGDHLSIGVGRHETHWTQNFGRDTPK